MGYTKVDDFTRGNIMFNFKNKVAVVTGGARGIGKCICEKFREAEASVCVIDLLDNDYFIGDIANKDTLERFATKVISDFGHVDYLINNAAPKMCGIAEGSYEDFEYALKVGVTAPFYLSKLFAPHFANGASIVNISSSRDRMSQPQTESYTAAKGGISSLTHALAVSFSGKGVAMTMLSRGSSVKTISQTKGILFLKLTLWAVKWALQRTRPASSTGC